MEMCKNCRHCKSVKGLSGKLHHCDLFGKSVKGKQSPCSEYREKRYGWR